MMKRSEVGKSNVSVVLVSVAIGLIALMLGRWLYQFIFEDSVGETTVKEIDSRAIAVSSRVMAGQNPESTTEYGPVTETGYPVSVYLVGNQFFEITLSDVPEAVCQYIMEKSPSFSTSIYVNGQLKQSKPILCRKSNIISFEFSRNLNVTVSDADKPYKTHCINSADCSACEQCQDGRCRSGCRSDEVCGLAYTGKEMCCLPQNKIESVCCSFIEDNQCCWGRQKCCPKDKPIRLENGECVSCYDPKPFAVGKPASLQKCLDFCPNRVAFGQDELCMLPICGAGQFTNQKGECVSCHQQGNEITSVAECQKCPNRVYHDGLCQAGCLAGHAMDQKGVCHVCDELEAFESDTCEASCSERENADGICRLKKCPDGFVANQKGDCVSCDSEGTMENMSVESCQQCPNRYYHEGNLCVNRCGENQFLSRDGKCVSCLEEKAIPVQVGDGECMRCSNRLGLNGYCFAECGPNHFRDSDGHCHVCTDKGSYPVLKTAVCHVCGNRAIQIDRQNGVNYFYCRLEKCGYDSIRDEKGACHDCYENDAIQQVSKEECDKCSNRMWSELGHQCFIKPTCLNEEITDAFGKCVSCYGADEVINVSGRLEECEKCDKRYVYGYWCRNCPADVRDLMSKESCQKCGGRWDNRIAKCL